MMTREFTPFLWVDKVVGGRHDPRLLQCAASLLGQQFYVCDKDMVFLEEVRKTINSTPANPATDKNQQLIQRYQKLCKTEGQEFQSLVELHRQKLTHLMQLDKAYQKKYDELYIKAGPYIYSTQPLWIKNEEESINSRKESWWANVRYHFKRAERGPLFSKSMLIFLGLA